MEAPLKHVEEMFRNGPQVKKGATPPIITWANPPRDVPTHPLASTKFVI